MEKELTLKQRKFLKKYIETGNATQSALEVYDTDDYSTAGAIACDNLKKAKIKDAYQLLMDKYGLTDGKLIEKHMQLLDAKKVISANITYGDADQNTTDFIDVDDNPTQLNALKLAYRQKRDDKQEVEHTGSVDFNIQIKEVGDAD